MNMAERDRDLEDLFAEARQSRPELPQDLAVRIETDAEAMRLGRLSEAPHAHPRRMLDWISGIGGWQGLGGLLAASAAGVWIGFSAPSFLPDPADLLVNQETTYLMADLSLGIDYLEDTE